MCSINYIYVKSSKGIETAKDSNQGTQLLCLRALQSPLVPLIDCSAYSAEMGLIALAGAGKGPYTCREHTFDKSSARLCHTHSVQTYNG
jgi:hypothetical protein